MTGILITFTVIKKRKDIGVCVRVLFKVADLREFVIFFNFEQGLP
jgi:hypothetical protein